MREDYFPLFIFQASNGKINVMSDRGAPLVDRFLDPKVSGIVDKFVFYPWDYPAQLLTEDLDTL